MSAPVKRVLEIVSFETGQVVDSYDVTGRPGSQVERLKRELLSSMSRERFYVSDVREDPSVTAWDTLPVVESPMMEGERYTIELDTKNHLVRFWTVSYLRDEECFFASSERQEHYDSDLCGLVDGLEREHGCKLVGVLPEFQAVAS